MGLKNSMPFFLLICRPYGASKYYAVFFYQYIAPMGLKTNNAAASILKAASERSGRSGTFFFTLERNWPRAARTDSWVASNTLIRFRPKKR